MFTKTILLAALLATTFAINAQPTQAQTMIHSANICPTICLYKITAKQKGKKVYMPIRCPATTGCKPTIRFAPNMDFFSRLRLRLSLGKKTVVFGHILWRFDHCPTLAVTWNSARPFKLHCKTATRNKLVQIISIREQNQRRLPSLSEAQQIDKKQGTKLPVKATRKIPKDPPTRNPPKRGQSI